MAPKERMQVPWRLDKLTEDKRNKINAWLDAQSNMQESITNVVIHAIARFGYTEITDYDVQKALYSDTILPVPASSAPLPAAEEKQTEDIDQVDSLQVAPPEVIEEPAATEKTDEKDDFFNSVDPNNL